LSSREDTPKPSWLTLITKWCDRDTKAKPARSSAVFGQMRALPMNREHRSGHCFDNGIWVTIKSNRQGH
jgi:hypothetical protein